MSRSADDLMLKNVWERASVLTSSVFAREALVYASGSGINAVLPVLLMPILTRYLSPTDYGIVATSTVLVAFLTMVIGLNTSGLIVGSEFGPSSEAQRHLVSTNLILAAGVAFVLIFVLAAAGASVEAVTKFPATWIPAVVLLAVLGVLRSIYLCLLQARHAAKRFIAIQVLATVTNLGLSIALVVGVGMDWRGRLLAMLVSAAIVGVMCVHGLSVRLAVLVPKFDKAAFRSLLSFGVPLIPHFIGGWFMTMAPRLYLNQMATLADTGLYSVAYAVASPVALFVGAANQAYVPALFGKLSRPDSLDRLQLSKRLVLAATLLIGLSVCYGFGARAILPLLVGPRFHQASDFIMWLSLAFAVQGVYFIFGNFVVFSRRTALMAWRADFLGGLVILVLAPFLIRLQGPIGVAQAVLLAFSVSCIGCFLASRRAYPMPWGRALRNLLSPIAADRSG